MKKGLIKKLSKKLGFEKKDKAKMEFDPYKKWHLIVNVFLVFNLLVILAGVYFFYQVKNEEIFKMDIRQEIEYKTIDKEHLNRIYEHIREKEERFQDLQN